MQSNQLKPAPGSHRTRKRVGRGNAAGQGTYSGRGLKGQKSRAGRKPRRYFEGGQTRLWRRLPRRRGFTNLFRVEFSAVNISDLRRFEPGAQVTPELLRETGIIRSLRKPVKILGNGEIGRPLKVSAHRFSLTAKEKIEAAGGTVTELMERQDKEAKRARRAEKRAKRAKSAQPAGQKAKAVEEASAEAKGGEAREREQPAEAEETESGDGS
jgi:large subunit ribosomal protein L15